MLITVILKLQCWIVLLLGNPNPRIGICVYSLVNHWSYIGYTYSYIHMAWTCFTLLFESDYYIWPRHVWIVLLGQEYLRLSNYSPSTWFVTLNLFQSSVLVTLDISIRYTQLFDSWASTTQLPSCLSQTRLSVNCIYLLASCSIVPAWEWLYPQGTIPDICYLFIWWTFLIWNIPLEVPMPIIHVLALATVMQ